MGSAIATIIVMLCLGALFLWFFSSEVVQGCLYGIGMIALLIFAGAIILFLVYLIVGSVAAYM